MAENLLGKHTPVVEHYSPELLYAIPRSTAREALGIQGALPFGGEDIWHAWELSWLGASGQPRAAVARFTVPCDSPSLVESKSFKLYLNSLNQTEFADGDALCSTLRTDLSAVAGARVGVELLDLADPTLQPVHLPGRCLDGLQAAGSAAEPDESLLSLTGEEGARQFHSHLLRSLCPVTGQPDWASLVIEIRGAQPDPASLLGYILSYRAHREFHEQCVERAYRDLNACCRPDFLSVQALYTRRGGLDINPWRVSEPRPAPRLRTTRQ